MKKIFSFVLFLITFSAVAQNASEQKFRKIDSLLTYLESGNKFMGSIALREGDKIVFAKAYGFLDSATKKKADRDTKYKIASISKVFTSIMTIQLIEEKKLRYEDKLSKFFPKIPNSDKITIEMLLRHRSGIHDYLADSVTSANITRKHTRAEVLERVANYPSDFGPDTKYEYSNSNYSILGYIIEDVTQKSYADNLQLRISKKLKLRNTYLPDHIDTAKNEAFSFTYNGLAWEQMPEWSNTLAFSAGALASTPTEVTLLLKSLFDGELMSGASLEKMKTIIDGYGLGLTTLPFGNRKFYGHTGGIENFRSVAAYNPEEKFGVSLMVNGDNYSRNNIMVGILKIYYGQPFEFPSLKGFDVKPEILQSYVGIYSSPGFPMKVEITLKNGNLLAQATGQSSFPLLAISETTFEFDQNAIKIEFATGKMNLKQGDLNVDFAKE